jgi:hypothetical protein
MSDTPIELDKHRGMAAQKATDIRRVIAEVEANATVLRECRRNRTAFRAGRQLARRGS